MGGLTVVFFVVYGASVEYPNRHLIPKRLAALGCRRIARSFWELDDTQAEAVLEITKNNQPLFLRKSRENHKPRFDTSGAMTDMGSMIVVSYSIDSDLKTKIKTLFPRIPCIRLCGTVYAFCPGHRRYDKKEELLDFTHFYFYLRKYAKDIHVFSRMTAANNDTMHQLLERAQMRIEKALQSVHEECERLIQTASILTQKERTERTSKLYRKFARVRKIALFYEKWLHLTLKNIIAKTYPLLRRLQLFPE